ncbi:MAG: TonB-dependent receptor [Bacteroidetes bacterium]|nr:TonB-dependent receptor [Bacteroidota bacterium]
MRMGFTLAFAKKLLRVGFMLTATLLLTSGLLAQRQVSGTILDNATGDPLIGASILVKGTSTGTVTDIDGKFALTASNEDVLIISYTGYEPQEIAVGNQTDITVQLAEGVLIDEVVVTAYATQKKKDLTGSVAVVKSEDLTAMPQGNVTQQLQGRVAGLTITQDSRPGQNAKVRIRGFGSFQNNSPLYIVDDVPTTDINTINPDDIASITVLKDAGAASIYGSRASNGVIVISTKKGSDGINVNYNMYYGSQNPGSGPDNMLSAKEYADLQWLVYANDGTTEDHPIYGSSSGSPSLPGWGADTKWYDEIFSNAPIMNHDLSMSGGNENAKFYASLGYFDQKGVVLENWWKRVSARVNSSFKIKDRVTIGENMNVVFRTDNGISTNGQEGSAVAMGVYRTQPIIPVTWNSGTYEGVTHTFENGDWGGTGIAPRLGNGNNYVAGRTRDKDDRWQNIRVLGNVFANVDILEGLSFKTSFGGSFHSNYSTDWGGSTYESAENRATSTYNNNSSYGADWTWTNTLTFTKSFGDHNVLGVGGYEAVKTGIGRGLNATGAGYFSDAISYRTVSNGANLSGGGSWFGTPRSLVSQFLRADYNFANRYYLSGTVRRDGASVFGADTRYGVFPSVSAGWRISDEAFFPAGGFFSDLKIRGGYGTMGNQLPVSVDNQFYLYGGNPNTSYYDLNGTSNSSLQGFRPTRIGNPDAKWETNVTTNVGFDAVLLDSKLEFVFDWYSKQNVDLLFDPELPGTAGGAGRPYVNVGEMKNSGIDLQLIYRQNWSDFNMEANAQFTTYNNEIIKIADGYDFFDGGGSRIGAFNRNQVGYSMGQFFGYNVLGLFESQAAVDAAATQDGAEPGFFQFEDVDGNGVIDPDDRTFIGNPNPDFTYGLNLNFGYKGFDFTAFFYGSQGAEIFNYNKWWLDFWPSFQGQKSTDLLNNSWTTSNTGASVPKASNKSNFSTNGQSTSYYVEDGSFFRLKNLQIGYTFPKSVTGGIFSNARVYVQGTNLITFTKYTGLDPELASFNDTFMGVDEGNLPAMKQFIIGLNVGF